VGSLGLMAIALYRWGVLAVGSHESEAWRESATSLRVLTAQTAQVIALVLVVALASWTRVAQASPMRSGLAFLSVPFILVLQHRTVWMACVAALAAAVVLSALHRRARLAGVLLPVLVCALLLGGLFALAPQSTISASLGNSTATNTLVWRVDSWQSLFSLWLQGGPQVWFTGKPFGASFTRFVESAGQETSVSAHSQYLSLLINGGVVAVAAYGYAAYRAVVGLWRQFRQPGGEDEISVVAPLLLACVSISVFGGAYNIDYAQALLLGLAMVVAQSAPADRVAPARAAARASRLHARPLPLKVLK
jgi:O-Antigen ligase